MIKRKKTVKRRRKVAKRMAAPKRRMIAHRPTGRSIGALERRDKLIEKYMQQGMSPEDARTRAVSEMRDNPRMDWRLK
jgi:hypothetical protein